MIYIPLSMVMQICLRGRGEGGIIPLLPDMRTNMFKITMLAYKHDQLKMHAKPFLFPEMINTLYTRTCEEDMLSFK